MAGQGWAALPVVPPPVPDERLSSWLARVSDHYLITIEELQTHIGWTSPLMELERRPGGPDLVRIAQATHLPVERIAAMTFVDATERYLSLLRQDNCDVCPSCAPGFARLPLLKSSAFAFGFWCPWHRLTLFGSDQQGLSMFCDEAAARDGARLLEGWARGATSNRAMPVGDAVSLLLSSRCPPTLPAPWELARLSPVELKRDAERLSRRCRHPILSLVVPEFDIAVPVCDQRVPTDMAGLASALRAVRYAVAISLARLMKSPTATTARILAGCDPATRTRVAAQIGRWPSAFQRGLRTPLQGRLRVSRKRETA